MNMEQMFEKNMVRASGTEPEEELVMKVQRGECGWIDYVRSRSPEWREEYEHFCADEGYDEDNHSALLFVRLTEQMAEMAMLVGRL